MPHYALHQFAHQMILQNLTVSVLSLVLPLYVRILLFSLPYGFFITENV